MKWPVLGNGKGFWVNPTPGGSQCTGLSPAPAIAQCALCAILNTNIALSIIVNCELNKLTNYQLSNILFYNI